MFVCACVRAHQALLDDDVRSVKTVCVCLSVCVRRGDRVRVPRLERGREEICVRALICAHVYKVSVHE